MESYPHHYRIEVSSDSEGWPTARGEGLPELATAPPRQFDGPGNRWSPETLLVASVADCFVLTFRAIAAASKLEWRHLDCEAEGVLERDGKVLRFTRMLLRARLVLPQSGQEGRGERLLHKAEESCLVTNSLTAERTLEAEVLVG